MNHIQAVRDEKKKTKDRLLELASSIQTIVNDYQMVTGDKISSIAFNFVDVSAIGDECPVTAIYDCSLLSKLIDE